MRSFLLKILATAALLTAALLAASVGFAKPVDLKSLVHSFNVHEVWQVAVLDAAVTLDDVLKRGSAGSSQPIGWAAQSRKPITLAPGRKQWVKLELEPFGETPSPRLIEFAMPGIDKIEAFRVEGGMLVLDEVAGDSISASVWPNSARFPVFDILAHRWEAVTYYFAISHQGPFTLSAQIVNPYDHSQSQMAHYLRSGVLLGALVLLACLGLAGGIWYKNWAFAVFAAYAAVTAALFFSANGMLGQFWSDAQAQSVNNAPRALAAAAAVFGLLHYLFAVSMQQLSRWRFVAGLVVCAAGLAVAGLMQLAPQVVPGGPASALLAYLALAFAMAVLTLGYAFFKDEPWTKMHFVSLATYLSVLIVPGLEALGLAALPLGMQDVLALGATASVGLTFFALNSKTRELNESNLRLEASAMADPLTGLANYRRLVVRASGLFSRAKHHNHHGALMLIEVANMADIQKLLGQRGLEAALLQSAVILRSSVKNIDLISRVSDQQFAVALEGPVTALDASDVAAKIIAGGMRVKPSVSMPLPLELRICIDLVPRETEDVDKLIASARSRLRRVRLGDTKRIFMVADARFSDKL